MTAAGIRWRGVLAVMAAAMATASACSSRDDTTSDGGAIDVAADRGANGDVAVDGGSNADVTVDGGVNADGGALGDGGANADGGALGDGGASDGRSGDASSPKCPPDLDAPIDPATCTNDRTPIDDKISAVDRQRFESGAGRFPVLIMVRDGATICTLAPCPVTPCPEHEAIHSRWTAENLASQRCVRDWLTAAGASISSETFWLVNGFEATLTWEQIKGVAAYPHVVHVESNGGSPPP